MYVDPRLYHLAPSSFDLVPAQRHDVPDAELPGAPRPLDGRWLGNVVEPSVGPLEEEVAPVP